MRPKLRYSYSYPRYPIARRPDLRLADWIGIHQGGWLPHTRQDRT